MSKKKVPKQLDLDFLLVHKRRKSTLQLQGLAVRLTNYATETEWINGFEYHYTYDIVRLVTEHGKNLKNDPKVIINKMLEKGYLIIRNQPGEEESYHICTSQEESARLKASLKNK